MNSDEYTPFGTFNDVGVLTTDTLGLWRKKENGIIQFINDVAANSSSDTTVLVDISNKKISIKNGGVVTALIADGSVTTNKIAPFGVTSEKIANLSVTNEKVTDGTLTGAKMVDNSIGGAKLTDLSILAAKLASGSVTTDKILDSNVTAAKLAANAVTTVKILDSNVTTNKLADLNVTAAKLAADSVTTVKILDSNVTTNKLANSAVTNAKIADSAIDGDKIGGSNVPRQIISDSTTSTSSYSGGSWQDTPLTKVITVKSGSRVRIQSTLYASNNDSDDPVAFRIVRTGAGAIGVPADAGDRTSAGGLARTGGAAQIGVCSLDWLESISSAGSYTYRIQIFVRSGATAYLNRSVTDNSAANYYRTTSTLFLTELS